MFFTQNRLFEECKQIFGDSDRTPSMADMAQMKYLDAVVKETLRLYPSVPFIARTITENFTMGDLKIKKDTEVAVHIYDLHHRPELFPNPEAFKPERFLTGETRHPYAYVPFSAGARNCIAQRARPVAVNPLLNPAHSAVALRAGFIHKI
ncbi:Cytochrome P450 [Operophtera brumata]|uniref:Cytochrome P450 n=1 Tax=Operophtera brumata TaxID=104452 RepID=A0A0L7KSV5_OPEBR|nr:Cytochrome P450 [Operophtera brumata]